MVMKIAFLKNKITCAEHIICWWTNGPYPHAELLIRDLGNDHYIVGTATPSEGVKVCVRSFNPSHWEIVDCPIGDPLEALRFFNKHFGAKYDWLGILGFVGRRGKQRKHKWFCSEAVASAIGLRNSWRYCPNTLYDIVKSFDTDTKLVTKTI